MVRIVFRLMGAYLALAVVGKLLEALGAVRCGCSEACWCQLPVISLVRWAFPYGHR